MLVNTIIIGAGRSGTTSLYEYMVQHPDINFSITKELHYFSIDDLYSRGEKYFHSLFNSSGKKIVATADTYLLIDKEAPQKIKNYNPEIKIIVLLREPVARAYSNFNYSKNFGHEDKNISFLGSMDRENVSLKNGNIVDRNNLCHFYGSLYFEHLSYWLQFFPLKNFIILKMDDLVKEPERFYKKLCFELDISYQPFSHQRKKFNASTGVKSKGLQQLLLNRESRFRKLLSIILGPFRNIIIRSGIVDRIYALNKKTVEIPLLLEDEKVICKKYFEKDLLQLERVFNINFKV